MTTGLYQVGLKLVDKGKVLIMLYTIIYDKIDTLQIKLWLTIYWHKYIQLWDSIQLCMFFRWCRHRILKMWAVFAFP